MKILINLVMLSFVLYFNVNDGVATAEQNLFTKLFTFLVGYVLYLNLDYQELLKRLKNLLTT